MLLTRPGGSLDFAGLTASADGPNLGFEIAPVRFHRDQHVKLDLHAETTATDDRPTTTVAVIDYGVGNVKSVAWALRRLGADVRITSQPDDVRSADKIVLPGVGAFDAAMRRLHESKLLPALQQRVIDQRTPILGICLGMQLFTRRSDEGETAGLGWLDAETRRFVMPEGSSSKVPHIGWNRIHLAGSSDLESVIDEPRHFYFAHSYHVVAARPDDVVAETEYGGERFASIIQADNLYGVQFHPELSHRNGLYFLRYFLDR